MSYLDRKNLLVANLIDRTVKESNGEVIKYCNLDKNVATLYMKFKTQDENGTNKEIEVSESSDYAVTLRILKPGYEVKEIIGVQSTYLNEECLIYKFVLTSDYTNQLKDYICTTIVKHDNQELILNKFVYSVYADETNKTNAEIITDPAHNVLLELIERVENLGTGGGGGSNKAEDIKIKDVNNNFNSDNVEGALNELSSKIGTTNISNPIIGDIEIISSPKTLDTVKESQEVTVEYELANKSSNVPSFTNLIKDYSLQAVRANVTNIDETINEQKAMSADTSSNSFFRWNIGNGGPTVGHKYYGSVIAKSTNGCNVKILANTQEPTTNEYVRYSAMEEYVSGSWYIGFTSQLSETDELYIKKPMLIDLTELYGAGNEPTKEEFDNIIGDIYAKENYVSSGATTETCHAIIKSYKSDNTLLDTLDTSVSDTNIKISSDGKIEVVADEFPTKLILKNVKQVGNITIPSITPSTTEEFKGLKWAAIGDSLTDSTINADKKYHKLIAEKTGITVQELAKGGTGYAIGEDGNTYYDRVLLIDEDVDIVTLFGSVNDWKCYPQNIGCSEIGTVNDTFDDSKTMKENTFCAVLNRTFDALFDRVPKAQVVVFGAMPYYGVGYTHFDDVRKALKDVCEHRHITYVDMFDSTGFYRIINNAIYAQTYTTDFNGDNYATQKSFGHPNNLAHKNIIAPIFLAELRKHLPF